MAMAQGNITLNSKVYVPSGFSGSIAGWRYSGTGVPTGFSNLTESIDVPSTARGATTTGQYRVKWKLKVPTIATDDSACACDGSVLRNTIADLVFTLHASGTTAERQDLLDQLDDLIADAQFRASILNLAYP